jgi:IclR family acetate operon transcriptional repressor
LPNSVYAVHPQDVALAGGATEVGGASRRRGYAIDDEEIEVGVRCIGAPIFNEDRKPIAAVSVSGPSSRITAQSVPDIAEHLLRCCRDISASMNWKQRTART